MEKNAKKVSAAKPEKKEISDKELNKATGGATPIGQGKVKPRQ